MGNYSTEDGTRTFYTELLHWIKEVLSENLDLMKSLLYNDLAEEKAKSLVGLDVTNDWSQESIEILLTYSSIRGSEFCLSGKTET